VRAKLGDVARKLSSRVGTTPGSGLGPPRVTCRTGGSAGLGAGRQMHRRVKEATGAAEELRGMPAPIVDPPAGPAQGATDQSGGVRKLLLDEIAVQREREPLPPPTLTIAPVPVPLVSGSGGRRDVKQRLAELEEVARRNLYAAEEARRVLFEQHERLEQEASARSDAEREAAALRRELDRLRENDERRTAQMRFAATREVRAEVAEEVARAQAEHARVISELNRLRGTLDDHDNLLEEYSQRLREEQMAVTSLRVELERAEESRMRAERELENEAEKARIRAADELERLRASESELRRTREERDRLADEVAALQSDDALKRLQSRLDTREQELTRLTEEIAQLKARAEAAEAAIADATREREELDAASIESEQRAREMDKLLGRLRKEASTATQARQATEQALAEARATIDEQHGRLEKLEKQLFASQQAIDELRERARSRPAAPPPPAKPAPSPAAAPAAAATAAPAPATAQAEPDPEPEEVSAPAADKKDKKAPGGQPNARRSAMAELTALAAISTEPRRK
jgi:chromosome segregation ATPase